MNRRHFVRLSGAAGAAAISGCETLDGLDTSASAEGTGIQVVGAIVVLAQYRANQKQQAAARSRAAKIYVSKALEPAHKAAVAQVKKKEIAEVKKVETVYRKKVATARKSAEPAVVVQVQKEQVEAVETVREEAKAEIAAWDDARMAIARKATSGGAPQIGSSGHGRISAPTAEERQLRAASVKQLSNPTLAVDVPRAGIQEERASAATVMFWDARSLDLKTREAFVISETPAVSKEAKIGSTRAQYWGAGR